MRFSLISLLAAGLFLSMFSIGINSPAQAQDEEITAFDISYGGDIDFNSKYVWRGIETSTDWVAQPQIWVKGGGFTFTLWGNYNFGDDAIKDKFTEYDYTLNYETQMGQVKVKPGVTLYDFPNQDLDTTTELQLDLSYPCKNFDIYMKNAYDISAFTGAYYGELGLTTSRSLNEEWTLDATVGAGWGDSNFNSGYIGVDKSALVSILAEVGATYYVTEAMYVRPHVNFSAMLDEDIRDAVNEPDNIVFGVKVGAEF